MLSIVVSRTIFGEGSACATGDATTNWLRSGPLNVDKRWQFHAQTPHPASPKSDKIGLFMSDFGDELSSHL